VVPVANRSWQFCRALCRSCHFRWPVASRTIKGVNAKTFLRAMARGPNCQVSLVERRERREAIRCLRCERDHPSRRVVTVLLSEREPPFRLAARVNSGWSRALSRLLARSLDRKLAEGRVPESHLLLAVRAQVLVSPDERLALAHRWDDLLRNAGRPPSPRSPRAPINRDVLLAHETAIRSLLELLVAPTPGHVSGIAKLSWLLSDGTGPVYDRGTAAELAGTLRDVTGLLASSCL
jgi:hypothetical protein